MGGPVWVLYLYPPRLRGRVGEGAAAAAERGIAASIRAAAHLELAPET
jgi:hypothetical protein